MLLRSSILGAIDGLIVGCSVELIRYTYGEYRWRATITEFESLGMSPPLMVDMLRWWAIPATVTIVFILVTLLVHRYLGTRIKSRLLLWEVIGVGSVIVWGILWQLLLLTGPPNGPFSIVPDLRRLQAGYTVTDLLVSGSFLPSWLVLLALAVLINAMYGSLLQILTPVYRANRVSQRAT